MENPNDKGCYWFYFNCQNSPCWPVLKTLRTDSAWVAAVAGPAAADWVQPVLGAGLAAADLE